MLLWLASQWLQPSALCGQTVLCVQLLLDKKMDLSVHYENTVFFTVHLKCLLSLSVSLTLQNSELAFIQSKHNPLFIHSIPYHSLSVHSSHPCHALLALVQF